MMDREQLESTVYELATHREELAIMQAELAKRQAQFERDNEVISANIRSHRAEIAGFETAIRSATYSADDRTPAPGLTVKMATRLSYSTSRAVAWAVEQKQPSLLVLNAARFEPVAKGLGLDWVTIEQVATVSIARDLSEAAKAIEAKRETVLSMAPAVSRERE